MTATVDALKTVDRAGNVLFAMMASKPEVDKDDSSSNTSAYVCSFTGKAEMERSDLKFAAIPVNTKNQAHVKLFRNKLKSKLGREKIGYGHADKNKRHPSCWPHFLLPYKKILKTRSCSVMNEEAETEPAIAYDIELDADSQKVMGKVNITVTYA